MPRAPKAPGHLVREPWRNSTRRARLPRDWPKRVAQVKRRSGGRCELVEGGARCERPGRDVDHVTPGDDHRLSNLQFLCVKHHKEKSAREGAAASRGTPWASE